MVEQKISEEGDHPTQRSDEGEVKVGKEEDEEKEDVNREEIEG